MTEKRLASATSLGFGGFALSTFVLSCQNLGIMPHLSGLWAVVPLGIFYGGLIQIIAAILEFVDGNTFGLTIFGSYGAFWLSFAFLVIFHKIGIIPSNAFDAAVGITLIPWEFFTIYATILSFRTKNLTLEIAFIFVNVVLIGLIAGHYTGSSIFTVLGGGVGGIILAVIVWYLSWKGVNDYFDRLEAEK